MHHIGQIVSDNYGWFILIGAVLTVVAFIAYGLIFSPNPSNWKWEKNKR